MELDSWQLQGFGESKISPHIAVFTNLMRDHMNYYNGSMTRYFQDKANIYKYQKVGDYLIAGKEIAKKIRSKGYPWTRGRLIIPKPISKSWKLKVVGEHNRENAALAACVASEVGAPKNIIKKALENFKGVEGRLQYLKTVRGVKVYNDNNATSPDATIAALRALKLDVRRPTSRPTSSKNIILIMGGADKGLDMKLLMKEIPKYCKSVVLLSGSGTDKLNMEYRILNIEKEKTNQNSKFQIPNSKILYYKADNLKQAISLAIKNSKKGDIVLFSPTFASFGMFKNEYDRNDQFINLVKKLK